jgi:hypothetical protein
MWILLQISQCIQVQRVALGVGEETPDVANKIPLPSQSPPPMSTVADPINMGEGHLSGGLVEVKLEADVETAESEMRIEEAMEHVQMASARCALAIRCPRPFLLDQICLTIVSSVLLQRHQRKATRLGEQYHSSLCRST